MTQQHLFFGSYPNDLNADAIRTAFSKVENNFNDLYSPGVSTGVTSLHSGVGTTVSQTSGNVVVSANINQVKIQTSTLTVGIGGTGFTNTTLTNGTQILHIDIGDSVTTETIDANIIENAQFAESASAQPNITSVGDLTDLTVIGLSQCGEIVAETIVVTDGNPITSVLTTDPPVQIGLTTVKNLVIGTSELQARDDGSASQLRVNPYGGNIILGNSSSSVYTSGTLTVAERAIFGANSDVEFRNQTPATDVNTAAVILSGGISVAANAIVNGSIMQGQGSSVLVEQSARTVSLATVSTVNIDNWDNAVYHACKYTITIVQGSNIHTADIMVAYGGSSAIMTSTNLSNTAILGTFSVLTSSSLVYLRLTMATGTSAKVTMHKILFRN